jgi:hypothetical protein
MKRVPFCFFGDGPANVPQFDEDDLSVSEDGVWFSCSMVSMCAPLFDDTPDNYQVEEKLRRAGVLTAGNKTDTETCALLVLFSTRTSGLNFLRRLNKYLLKKAELTETARRF